MTMPSGVRSVMGERHAPAGWCAAPTGFARWPLPAQRYRFGEDLARLDPLVDGGCAVSFTMRYYRGRN